MLPIITEEAPDALTLAEWGLRPFWAKPDQPVKRPINARAETVDTAATFRRAFRERRCLVPATGFFEWQKQGKGKQPYRIRRADGEPFAFAGLYEEPDGEEGHPSYTVITTDANELMAQIHDRMPVILRAEDEEAWLDPDTPEERLKQLLRPYPERELEAYPISTLVNSPRNDTPDIFTPETR